MKNLRLHFFILTALLITVAFTALGQTNTWSGALDNDWHKSCNWSLNQIPACSHDVVIPNTSNKPVVTGIAHSRTVDIQSLSGAELTIATGSGGTLYMSSTNGGGCSGTPTNNSAACCASGSALLPYTAGLQTWVVPACVTSITYTVRGAQGGAGYPAISRGGYGGEVSGTLAVTPNETLYFYVGGAGGNGGICNPGYGGYNGGGTSQYSCNSFSGGGGGGASDIRRGGTALANRVVVAGGGGGGAYNYGTTDYDRGGAGGGSTGGQGYGGNVQSNGTHYGGGGGTQSAGGAGGWHSGYCFGGAGSAGQGGNGGTCNNTGGGGGGGYFGGGGGVWTGGGGGSNYPTAGSQGTVAGNGSISIGW